MDSQSNQNRFHGRVALITGAGSGIGRAVTERLVAEGAYVYAVDIDETALNAVARELGERVSIHAVDLSTSGAGQAVVDGCVGQFGRLDVLGNVAGIYRTGHATELTEVQLDLITRVNLQAPVMLSIAAIPHLIESAGTIVTIASHSGLQGVPYALAYSITKAGLIAMTRSLAVEYVKSPIRVNAIAPGGTNTPMASGARFPDDVDFSLLARLGGHRPMTEPGEVAAVFAFLASDEARSVTGAVYAVDNGLTAS